MISMALLGDASTTTLRAHNAAVVAPLVANLPEGVVSFDGFLALETRSRYTVQTKEGVVALHTSGRAVALLKTFVTLFASHTTARAIDGVVRVRVSKPHLPRCTAADQTSFLLMLLHRHGNTI